MVEMCPLQYMHSLVTYTEPGFRCLNKASIAQLTWLGDCVPDIREEKPNVACSPRRQRGAEVPCEEFDYSVQFAFVWL